MGTRIQKVSTIGAGNVNVFPCPVIAQRAPTTSDVEYPLGQVWSDSTLLPATLYIYLGAGSWNLAENTLATNAQAVAGTNNAVSVTPAALTARLTSATPVSGTATTQISNARIGRVTFTTVSIAAGATSTFTITNSFITASSVIAVELSGCTAGAALSVVSITPGAGTVAIVVTNGTGATTTTAALSITFQVWG